MNLNQFLPLRTLLVKIKWAYYTKFWKMDLHETCSFSLSARFDRTNPRGVHVGAYSLVAFDAAILTHDLVRGARRHTRIGKNCFVGARSVILPGVTIGDGSIIGAGSVVTQDIPPGSIAVGNPARVVRSGITVGPYGRLLDADAVQAAESKDFE
jgi:acetyltransferase-like isoleucine patch superfamily enzyme